MIVKNLTQSNPRIDQNLNVILDASTMMNELNELEMLNADQCDPRSDDVDNNLFNKHNTEGEIDLPKIMDVKLEFELQSPQKNEEIHNSEVTTINHNTDIMPEFKFILPNSNDEKPLFDTNNHGIISGDNAINNTNQTCIQIANVKNEKFESSEGCKYFFYHFAIYYFYIIGLVYTYIIEKIINHRRHRNKPSNK